MTDVKPAFSPFDVDRGRKRFDTPVAAAVASPVVPSPVVPMPVVKAPVVQAPVVQEPVVKPSVVKEPEIRAAVAEVGPESDAVVAVEWTPVAAAATTANVPAAQSAEAGALQQVAVQALTDATGQDSAADAMGDAEWSIDGQSVQVQTQLSKTMLGVVVNPVAERIIREALRGQGDGGWKLTLLPGVVKAAAPKAKRVARSGSAQAKAMEHPMVQQAQRLFSAEVLNVIDLSEGK